MGFWKDVIGIGLFDEPAPPYYQSPETKIGDTVDVRGKPYTVIGIEGRHLIVEPKAEPLDLGTGEGLTYTRPPLPRPANRIEEEIRRRLASGDAT